jgi:chorismate mutase
MTPDRPEPDSLSRIRQEIESVDRSIVLLLAARLEAADRAIRARAAHDRHVTDREQERRVLVRGRTWAEELGLPRPLVENLFRSLLEEGKARYLSAEGPPDSPFVTVLLAAPAGLAVSSRRDAHSQLVAVPTSR